MATGYPDYGTPGAIAAEIGKLGIASQSLQATAAQIATALQQEGVPPMVQGLESAELLKQPASGSPFTIVGPFSTDVLLWSVQLSYTSSSSSAYSGQTNVYARIVTVTSPAKTLAFLEEPLSGPSQVNQQTTTPPLYGLKLAAGDSIQLDVNNGTSVTDVQQSASAVILYTGVAATPTPPPQSPLMLVGSYVDPADWGSGVTQAQAQADWVGITGRPLTVRRVYWGAAGSNNPMPLAITGPGYGAGAGQQADAAAGIKNCISLKPAYNPESATDLANIETYLSSCKNAGLVADVTLWHEPYHDGFTVSEYTTMFNYYAPTIRKYYPTAFVMSAYAAQIHSETSYFPGTTNCDKVAADFYGDDYISSSITLDAAAGVADTNSLPFGLWEFNASPQQITDAQISEYWTYVNNYFSTRQSNSLVNADLVLFNHNETLAAPAITTSSDYRVPLFQGTYDTFNGTT